MKEEKTIPNIKELSSALLDSYSDPQEVERILNEVHKHFQELTNLSGFDQEIKHLAAVPTATGMALSLNYAAQCLLDYKRTVHFLRGIVAAIKDKQKELSGETVNIFYAGCGPYAPFISLVAPLFKPSEVQFSLLEINDESLESAKKLIDALELSDYVQDYHRSDAVTFKFSEPEKFHILFSETLDSLLYRESYVPILGNMLGQLPESIGLIPENVVIKASLFFDEDKEKQGETVFDTRQALTLHGRTAELPIEFPLHIFNLREDHAAKGLVLDTEVHVYGDIKLIRGESILTTPYELLFNSPMEHTKVAFAYQLKPSVELTFEYQ